MTPERPWELDIHHYDDSDHDTDDDTDDDHDDDHDDDTDDDNDHKNDSYTAAGAAPGASIIGPQSIGPQIRQDMQQLLFQVMNISNY